MVTVLVLKKFLRAKYLTLLDSRLRGNDGGDWVGF